MRSDHVGFACWLGEPASVDNNCTVEAMTFVFWCFLWSSESLIRGFAARGFWSDIVGLATDKRLVEQKYALVKGEGD